ncbi:cell division protein [Escherichia coli]|nr:cell division protein [Escherichia coli]
MAVLGLQGVRGGVGTTTITAALAWSLQMLGENVLVRCLPGQLVAPVI